MKKFLLIHNAGLIEQEDLFLIGSSTKRGNEEKIGMFGSGWKYSLAYFLRNHLSVKLFSGKEEIIIDDTIVLHRNVPVRVITINGIETSLTTSMGPKWTGWMAIREMISNAIDEGEFSLTTVLNPDAFIPKDDKSTTLYIECNDEINECIRNFDNYFAFERVPELSNRKGDIFVKDIASDCILYRKGIRCSNGFHETYIDVSFDEIEINESRLVDSERAVDVAVSNIIKEGGVTKKLLIALLKGDYKDFLPYNYTSEIHTLLKELIDSGIDLITQKILHMKDYVNIEDNYLIIPIRWWRDLVDNGDLASPFEKNTSVDGENLVLIENHNFNIEEIKSYLSKFSLENSIIQIAHWNSYYSTVGSNGIAYFIHAENAKTYSSKVLAARIILSTEVSKIEAIL